MKYRSLLVVAVGVSALALTACSSTSPDGTGSPQSGAVPEQPAAAIVAGVKPVDDVAALLPEKYASNGVLQIGSNVQVPPANYYAADGTTPIGYEVDLATAIAKRLGVEVKYNDFAFESLITSLESGRIDFTIANMNDRPDRQEKIDFVDYFKTGTGILVQAGNPEDIASPEDLCGKTVSAGVGTSQETYANALSEQCVADGGNPIDLVVNTNTQQRLNSLKTGRVVAELNDVSTAAYAAQTAGGGDDFEIVDIAPLEPAYYGIGFNKDTPELRDAVRASLQSLIDDGTYAEILEAYGQQTSVITEATVNAGT